MFGDYRFDRNKYHWIKNANVDMTTDNIFVIDDGKWLVIDNEWVMDFYVPCEYILWYSIYDYLEKNVDDKENYYDGINKLIGIDDSDVVLFRKWMHHFVYNYVGTSKLDYKTKNLTDLQKIYKDSLVVDKARKIENSTIWKLTEPLRLVMNLIKRK